MYVMGFMRVLLSDLPLFALLYMLARTAARAAR